MTKMKILDRLLIAFAVLAVIYILSLSDIFAGLGQKAKNAPVTYKLEHIATGLSHPWSLAFLPDGDLLVTERDGRLSRIAKDTGKKQIIQNLPPVISYGQGGLLEVLPHPDFAGNGLIYLSHSIPVGDKVTLAVTTAKLEGAELTELREIFRLPKPSSSGVHFGSRMVFDNEGFLYVSIGERGDRPRAQDKSDPAGGIIRLNGDGTIPESNPFYGDKTAHPALYALGIRNAQGMAVHPETGEIWFHEHGPRGGDEVNILEAGANYGWPRITYGKEYALPKNVGEAGEADWVKPPLHVWTPSIAPSGMAFYTGDAFPAWKGALFAGALAGTHLARLMLDGEKITAEEKLLAETGWRIRDVRQGPDGLLYLLFDEAESGIYRLAPLE